MESRMNKYNDTNIDNVPKRSERNKELYKQVYNAYDEFENLVVPSNAKEIDLSTLKKEISSRDEYKRIKDYGDITNNKIIRKEIVQEEQKKENEIYDINVLINNAVKENYKEETILEDSDNYLKKLKLEDIDNVSLEDEVVPEDELLKTANLSLEILSDLKGDNDNTIVEAPVNEEITNNDDNQFYSGKYKFSDNDFDNKNNDLNDEFLSEENTSNGKFFLKVFLSIFGILLVVAVVLLIM